MQDSTDGPVIKLTWRKCTPEIVDFPQRARGWVQVCLFPLAAVWGRNYQVLFLRVSGGWNFRISKVAMSLGQSPLAASSGVGSSGWAWLQRRLDSKEWDGSWLQRWMRHRWSLLDAHLKTCIALLNYSQDCGLSCP